MIPPFRPALGPGELLAALRFGGDPALAVRRFERALADTFGLRDAVAFSYGRTALWAFLETLGIRGAEVVVPAYTCSVVAHAVVLSGNTPRFVDARPGDLNMDLRKVEAALSPQTRCVVATHLFGTPLELDAVRALVASAEARWGHRIWVVQDCAHSFAAEQQGRSVMAAPDVALVGLNVSKALTSVFGGALAGDDLELLQRVRAFRQQRLTPAGRLQELRRLAYLLAVYGAFSRAGYRWTRRLAETPLLDSFTKAYHRDDRIQLPPDALCAMGGLEARVGQVNLRRWESIVQRRRENAATYDRALQGLECVTLPPQVEGASWSHYTVRVPDRRALRAATSRRGVELGEVIQYSVPDSPAYRAWTRPGEEFPVARAASQSVVNLPLAGISDDERALVARVVREEAVRLWGRGLGAPKGSGARV